MTIARTGVPILLHEAFPGVVPAPDEGADNACDALVSAIVTAAEGELQPQDDPFLMQAFAVIEQIATDGDRLARDMVQDDFCEPLENLLHNEPGRLAACMELMGPATRALMEQLLRGPA
jgi:hypothetical protein